MHPKNTKTDITINKHKVHICSMYTSVSTLLVENVFSPFPLPREQRPAPLPPPGVESDQWTPFIS